MTGFVKNMIWNSVSGFVEEGKRTVGGYAGDALIKAGDLVEGGGRTVGNGIEKKATGLGTTIGGHPPKAPAAKALPSTARRPAAHRSSSLPANTKPKAPVGSSVPLGAKKTPAGKAAGAAAVKRAGGAASGAKSVVGGAAPGAKNIVGGAASNARNTVGGAASTAKNTVGGATSTAKNTAGGAALPKFTPKPFNASKPYSPPTPKGNANAASTSSLPKAFPTGGAGGAANQLPKPYGGAGNKTPVRPGQNKPFSAAKANVPGGGGGGADVGGAVKPYPGTNTLPGQASKTPVKKYKPAPRYEPPVKPGEMKTFF
ncbi:hypothetical protein P171DRAFT_411275 [Karstenula rhodostoma CBS 690.94]|uniref:Uncharacterized protein n=1 Tax=Karstenula rhodostoma CBS 690.94 TaxID=1392251 RepID=A0A9P4PLE7_9PLEO|nr:hypothetical protein P171DRAFT_411275 [Karstenula rhodostoma CBS 690.94]